MCKLGKLNRSSTTKEKERVLISLLSRLEKVSIQFSYRFLVFNTLGVNGYVYETFGTSKHFPVKLQALLTRVEMLDNALTAKCFIYDVVRSAFIFFIILL